jgi:flagellin
MPLVINTNVAALNSQRQLVKSGEDMAQAMERLSSGKRINTAADDAAGLAISNRMTSQVQGLNQAIRNANDGISLIQTAEGALDETTNILQRMRELAIQSANGIYADEDRATLDAEVQQLLEELDRIAETTSFNGQQLLDGTLGSVDLQVGSEANQTIGFSIQAMSTDQLGLGSTSGDLTGDRFDATGSFNDGDIIVNGVGLAAHDFANDNLENLINDINQNVEGVSAEAFNIVEGDTVGSGILSGDEAIQITLGTVNGQPPTNFLFQNTANLTELVSAINATTGGTVEASISDTGRLVLSNTTGGDITVAVDDDASAGFVANEAGAFTLEAITGMQDTGAAGTETFSGSLSLTSDTGEGITVIKGANGTDADLSALGFRTIENPGELVSGALDAASQALPMVASDLTINGVGIGAVASTDGLGGKIDAINEVSDETGVTASILATESYTINTAGAVEIVATTFGARIAGETTLVMNGVNVSIGTADTATDMSVAINTLTSSHGVKAFVDSDGELHLFSSSNITLNDTGGALVGDIFGGNATAGSSHAVSAPASGSISLNNVEVTITDADDINQVVTDINVAQGNTGVRASVDENGELRLESFSAITVGLGTSGDSMAAAFAMGIDFSDTDGDNVLADEVVLINPRIKLDSANDQPISIDVVGSSVTDATGLVDVNTDLSSLVTGSALSSISVATAAGAQGAIDPIDQALETINATRSQLGAVTNRLQFTMSNLMNVTENTSAARSRIMDADFAAETANLSRAQVLQQASQAMLAQANAAPQQVLQLLNG